MADKEQPKKWPTLDEVFAKHQLNEKEKDIVTVNINLLSRSIVGYFKEKDNDALDTLDIWLANIDTLCLMNNQKVLAAVGDLAQPILDSLEAASRVPSRRRKR